MARTFLSTTSHSQQAHKKVDSLSPLPQLALNTHLFPHLYFWGPPSAFHILLCCVVNNTVVPILTNFSIPYTDLELTNPDNVKIKAFLLLQWTVLNMGEMLVKSDKEVRQIVWVLGC